MLMMSAEEQSSDISQQAHKSYSSTKLGEKLLHDGLSTNMAARALRTMYDYGCSTDTPSQSGIWRAMIRDGKKKQEKIKKLMTQEENFCLHFDGKKLEKKEYQAVCLQNEQRSIKLGILLCRSGSAGDIFNELKNLLDEFDCWERIKMIITDTTAVNTGKKGGVVARLNSIFLAKQLPVPQYIGCQHHILDRILKLIMDDVLQDKTTNPDINYGFIDEISDSNYSQLQKDYKHDNVTLNDDENPGWRDDFRFLFDLSRSFKYFRVRISKIHLLTCVNRSYILVSQQISHYYIQIAAMFA